MKLRFTPMERDLILHRLGVPDALADCLSDETGDDTARFDWRAVHDAADRMRCALEKSFELDTGTLSDLQRAILTDCIDGSTWFCGSGPEDALACGEITKSQYRTRLKATETCTAKLNSVGIKCQFPNY
jgi:hypothetical protein